MNKTIRLLGVWCVCLCVLAGSVYAAEKISLSFKDTDISIVLQALSEKSGINIVLTPDVSGAVSIKLKDVSWETGLDVLLKTYNYGYEWIGDDIIMVDTIEKLREKRQVQAEAQAEEPLRTRAIALNFAKVKDVAPVVKNMLSERGRLTFDVRTNTLVLTETSANLSDLEKAVARFDRITPQVEIQARIIETNFDEDTDIGMKWNLALAMGGSSRPSTWPFKESSNTTFLPGTFSGAHPLNTDDFTYGTLNAEGLSFALDMVLSDNEAKVLSEPRITTMDNTPARIRVLTKDPVPNYTYNAETGSWEIAGFEEKEYGVTLDVTPQINDQGYVTLSVAPTISDKISDVEIGIGSNTILVPQISEQTALTKVMIKDGDTLVIAGLVKDKTTDLTTKVPFLGDVPVLGKLFTHNTVDKRKKNLLIFITPKVVTPELPEKKDESEKEEQPVAQ